MTWSQPLRPAQLAKRGVPDAAGLYVWRRCLPKTAEVMESSNALVTWLLRALEAPFFHGDDLLLTDDSKQESKRSLRSRFFSVKRVRVGGGELTPEKLTLLKERAADIQWRQRTYLQLLSSTELLGPVLYVGEGQSLRVRIEDHLVGRSALQERLEILGLTLDDVVVQYMTTPDLDSSERTLLEQCLTHILIAPLTVKAG